MDILFTITGDNNCVFVSQLYFPHHNQLVAKTEPNNQF